MRNGTAMRSGNARPVTSMTRTSLSGVDDQPQSDDQVLTTRVGFQFPAALPYESWERAGRQLFRMTDSFAWGMGDWLVYGQEHYADRYRRTVELVGLDYQTLRNYASVARRVAMSRRKPALSFQHHAEVASLPPAQQELWLARAEGGKWTRNQLRRQLRDARRIEGAPAETGPATLPRVPVTGDRMVRWRAAALHSSAKLENWIVAVLDDAAERALGPDWAPHE